MIIVIEGLDGTGKETQTKLLEQNLKENNKQVFTFTYPHYDLDTSIFVKEYLNGVYGEPSKLEPQKTILFYALDRFASYNKCWKSINEDKNNIIILDRYTTSNILYQSTKDMKNQDKLIGYIKDLEYGLLELPKPDLVIFLNLPFEVQQKMLKARWEDSSILNQKDGHELDVEYLKQVYDASISIATKEKWSIINCSDKNGNILTKEEISKIIINELRNHIIF